MTTTRIKDIAKTATTIASDDYFVKDGTTNGTSKIGRNDTYTEFAAAFVAAPTTYKLAPLNSGTNKIDATYLPTSADTPKGGWNASTNSPVLADGSGTAGDNYDVTTAGTQNLGSGDITFTVGDVVKYNGSTWYKIDSVANVLNGVADAATARATLAVPSDAELAEFIGTKLNGPSLYFDGVDDHVNVADDAKLSFTDGTDDLPFSLSAWIRMDDATDFAIVSKYQSSNEWIFDCNSSDKLRLFLETSSGNSYRIESTTALTSYEGQVIHVAVSYAGAGPNSDNAFSAAGDGMTLYVNGEAVASSTIQAGTYAGMSNTTDALRIGHRSTRFAEGHIYAVRIYNYALSAADVLDDIRGVTHQKSLWGGATGGVYTSDFSAGVDGWAATNGTAVGNIDSIGGQDDNLRLTVDTSTGAHYLQDNRLTAGKINLVTFDYYIPSGQSNVDGIRVDETGSITTLLATESAPTLDAWNRMSVVTNGLQGNNTLRISALDGGTNSFTDSGGDDVLYVRNINVTQVGVLADFRVENLCAGKLIDRSSNNFVGTISGALLVGGHKAIQINTNASAAGNAVFTIYDGTNHLVYATDKGDVNVNSISSGASTELTIATGAVTATKSYHTIDTEGDAATDDLDTISGGRAGQILVVQAANGARDVVLKDGTGNLKLSSDITLDNAEDTATLISNGTNWYLLATSNNGA